MPTEPEPWTIKVGRSPVTGKWHAHISTPTGQGFISPACETEQEACAQREAGLAHLKNVLGNKVLNVRRVQ